MDKKLLFDVLDLQGLDYKQLEYQATAHIEGLTQKQAEARKVVRVRAYAEMIRLSVKRILGRGDNGHASNIMINLVFATYKSMGINSLNDIADDLLTIKGAKNRDELVYNIRTGARSGERGEGTELEFNDLDF